MVRRCSRRSSMRPARWLNAVILIALLCATGFAVPESPDGTTPLHWAVHNNEASSVDRLIKAGANVNARNEYGATPLSEAVANLNTAIIAKLLNAGADPNAPGPDGMTALMVVA